MASSGTYSVIGTVAGLLAFQVGCTTAAPKFEEHPMTFPSSSAQVRAKREWTRKLPGLLTDLNISQDGSTILVATVPDHDAIDSGGKNQNMAVFYSSAGTKL